RRDFLPKRCHQAAPPPYSTTTATRVAGPDEHEHPNGQEYGDGDGGVAHEANVLAAPRARLGDRVRRHRRCGRAPRRAPGGCGPGAKGASAERQGLPAAVAQDGGVPRVPAAPPALRLSDPEGRTASSRAPRLRLSDRPAVDQAPHVQAALRVERRDGERFRRSEKALTGRSREGAAEPTPRGAGQELAR